MADKPLKVAPGGVVEKLAFMPVVGRKVPFARSRSQETIFYTLGGKREKKPDGLMESDLEALIREGKEEGDIDIDPASVQLVHEFVGPCYGYTPETKLVMRCYTGTWSGELRPSNEVAEIVWFTSADKHRTTPLGVEILEWFYAQNLID